jgi:hypothetical protein
MAQPDLTAFRKPVELWIGRERQHHVPSGDADMVEQPRDAFGCSLATASRDAKELRGDLRLGEIPLRKTRVDGNNPRHRRIGVSVS